MPNQRIVVAVFKAGRTPDANTTRSPTCVRPAKILKGAEALALLAYQEKHASTDGFEDAYDTVFWKLIYVLRTRASLRQSAVSTQGRIP